MSEQPLVNVQALSPAAVRRNFRYGVVNSALFGFFDAIADPSLVLTWFVGQLTTSSVIVGLLFPITDVGWFLPQLLVSRSIQRLPRKVVWYGRTAVARLGVWAALSLLVLLWGKRSETVLLGAFLLLYAVFCTVAGIAGPSFMEVIGKAIPARQRGSFFAWRGLTGGLLAIVGAVVVRFVLDERRGWTFPVNFGWLFALGLPCIAAAMYAFTRMDEPEQSVAEVEGNPMVGPRSSLRVLREDPNLVIFVIARVVLLVALCARPFYTVFARDRLNAPVWMVGVYLAALRAALVGSTMFWGKLRDRLGGKLVMVLVSILSIPLTVAPLLLVGRWSYAWFTAVFVLQGIVISGTDIFSLTLILDLAPLDKRVMYIGLTNTLLGFSSLLLAGAGFVAQRWGLEALFGGCAASAILAPVLVMRLREPQTSVEPEASPATPLGAP